MPNALARICADVGVELIARGTAYGPGQTDAKDMLDSMRKRGEAHLVMLLRVFIDSSPENAVEMHEPVLEAISEIMRAEPAWVGSGLRWLEAFDTIDLPRGQSHPFHGSAALRQGVAVCNTFAF